MYNSGSPFEECHIIVSIQQQSTQNETFIAMNILQYYKILKFIKKIVSRHVLHVLTYHSFYRSMGICRNLLHSQLPNFQPL